MHSSSIFFDNYLDWFNLLGSTDFQELDKQSKDDTLSLFQKIRICFIKFQNAFVTTDDKAFQPGTYIRVFTLGEALQNKDKYATYKLRYAYIYKIYSMHSNILCSEPFIDAVVKEGKVKAHIEILLKAKFSYFTNLNKKVERNYFGFIWGIIPRILSAFATFFEVHNYNVQLNQPKKWEWTGSSINYADKVIAELYQKRRQFFAAIEKKLEKELIACLEIPADEVEKNGIVNLKKYYNKKVVAVHPDKPKGNRDEFEKVNSIYSTYNEFIKLKKEYKFDKPENKDFDVK